LLTFPSLGAAGVTFGLPLVVYISTFLCNDISGCPIPSLLHPSTLTLDKLKQESGWPAEGFTGLIDFTVIGWVLAYYALSLFLQLALPGDEVDGVVLGTGGRHHYKFNTFTSNILIFAGLAAGTYLQGAAFPVWPFIYSNINKIITANLLIAIAQSIYVYLASFSVPHPNQPNPTHRELAKGGHSGNMLYDFFIGRELNPRISLPFLNQTIDIKCFNEMRPGLPGWIILNLAFIAKQYSAHGVISDSILIVTAFQSLYVADSLYMESSITTQMDITTDGFGFMLAFGDLVWLPFTYSLQARYLSVYPVHLGYSGILLMLAIQAVGFYIFRASNNEKGRFRTDPTDPRVAHLKYMETSTGTKLLTSGWWGLSRHPNYFGDLLMGVSYCVPTGVAGYIVHNYKNPVTGVVSSEVVQGDARGWGMLFTYFYVVYFGVLLVHRGLRDDEKCRRKYGKDWDRYCEVVRWRIIPYIY
jgi:delta14-sterol reductase